MSKRNMTLTCSFRDLHILKHMLRDKEKRSGEETRLLDNISQTINWYREKYRIPRIERCTK